MDEEGGEGVDVVTEVLVKHPWLGRKVRECEERRAHLFGEMSRLFLEPDALRMRAQLATFHAELAEALHLHGHVFAMVREAVERHVPVVRYPVCIPGIVKAPSPAESAVLLRVAETRVSAGGEEPPPERPGDGPEGGGGGKG